MVYFQRKYAMMDVNDMKVFSVIITATINYNLNRKIAKGKRKTLLI